MHQLITSRQGGGTGLVQMSSRRRVVITGLGAVTPLGDTAQASWHNLLSGLSGIKNILALPEWSQLHPQLGKLPSHLGAPVQSISPLASSRTLKLPRSFLFAEMAAAEALKDANLPADVLENVGVFFGCGLPGASEVYDNSLSISTGVHSKHVQFI